MVRPALLTAWWWRLLVASLTVACGGDSRPATPSEAVYRLRLHDTHASVEFPGYRAVVQYGDPFGIVTLEMAAQPGTFAHWHLPLADWEWFWYDEDGRDTPQKRAKLIDPIWSGPAVYESADSLKLVFHRQDVVLPGIDLTVDYTFRAGGSFSATYSIANQRPATLHMPYAMIGFPGFSNHKWVSAVATAQESRESQTPYSNFWQEAAALGHKEYTLLRDDGDGGPAHTFKGLIAMSTFDATYILEATYQVSGVEASVRSAHVNKPGYLTSHLYMLLKDMAPNDSVSIPVHYQLSRDGEHSVSLW